MPDYAEREQEHEEEHNSEDRPFDLKNRQNPAEIFQAKLQARLKDEAFVSPLQKFLIQKQETSPTSSPIPVSLLVENDALPEAGQMHKSEFLEQVHAHVCQVVEDALADTPYSSDNCPYLRRIFAQHEYSSPAQIEELLHRY
ncbi:MAG: hypothetical protein NW226_00750, partial [Microscillaceae bacterium]|nr:hypothetical protein [Microscillaceae bacterium]